MAQARTLTDAELDKALTYADTTKSHDFSTQHKIYVKC